jgi:molecular chaperone DnaK
MGSALYQQPGAEGAATGDAGSAGGPQADAGADDVVDAEIVDEEKSDK